MGEGDFVTSLEAGPPRDRRGASSQHPGATPRRARPRRTLLHGEAGVDAPALDPGPNSPPAELLLGATVAEPFEPLACVRLGYLLLDLGQLEDAHAAFRRAIAAGPHLGDAWRGLATLLERNGDWSLAAATLHRATRCTDRRLSDWGRLARVLESHGHPEAARACLRRWAKGAPEDPQPRIRLGRLCLEADRLEEARLVLETAIQLAPAALDARLLLVRVHLRAGRLEAAFGVAEAAADLAPAEPEVVRAFAVAAQLAGRPGLAVRRCAALLASTRDDADTRIALGLLHQAQGRTESACRHLRRAIELAPRSGEAFLRFVQVGRIPPGDRALLREMERRAADEALPRAARVRIHFALGKAWEDLGDHACAFEHFRRGNALEVPASPFDPVLFEAQVERQLRGWTAERLRAIAAFGHPSERPLFIVGIPSSGLLLAERLLARHPRVHAGGELSVLPPAVDEAWDTDGRGIAPADVVPATRGWMERKARKYLEILDQLAPAAVRVTDRTPGRFLQVGLLAALFPRARFLHCEREPVEACVASFTRLFPPGPGHACTWTLHGLGIYARGCRRLMAHWHRLLPGRILDLPHAALLDPDASLRRAVLAHCGLERVADGPDRSEALGRLPPGPGAGGPAVPRAGRNGAWQRHAAHLDDLRNALDPSGPVRGPCPAGD